MSIELDWQWQRQCGKKVFANLRACSITFFGLANIIHPAVRHNQWTPGGGDGDGDGNGFDGSCLVSYFRLLPLCAALSQCYYCSHAYTSAGNVQLGENLNYFFRFQLISSKHFQRQEIRKANRFIITIDGHRIVPWAWTNEMNPWSTQSMYSAEIIIVCHVLKVRPNHGVCANFLEHRKKKKTHTRTARVECSLLGHPDAYATRRHIFYTFISIVFSSALVCSTAGHYSLWICEACYMRPPRSPTRNIIVLHVDWFTSFMTTELCIIIMQYLCNLLAVHT